MRRPAAAGVGGGVRGARVARKLKHPSGSERRTRRVYDGTATWTPATGTALGLAISNLWIPYFKAGTDEWARVLPPSVEVAWSAVVGIYLLFGLLLIVILALSVAMSRRFRLADAVKLMDTT